MRYFINAPAFPDIAAVEEYADRIGAISVGGYRGVDGLRCCVEIPEVAIERIADEAQVVLSRSAALRVTAEKAHRALQARVCGVFGVPAGLDAGQDASGPQNAGGAK